MSDFQLAMIAAGAAIIIVVICYNLWQERRARRHAEQLFRPAERDALLDGDDIAPIPPAPGGRMEPSLPGNEVDAPAAPVVPSVRATTNTSLTGKGRTPAAQQKATQPSVPVESQAIDCLVTIEAPAGIAAASLFTAQQALLAGFSKPLRWFGWDDGDNQWLPLDARSSVSLNRASAALQLVDRRGAIGESDLARFYEQVQQLCDQFLAVPRLPQRGEVLSRAAELDRFCADVDIQIAINIVAKEGAFPGTKIRGLAEAAGLVLLADGAYHARDDEERTLFTLSNQETSMFSAEQLRHLHTTGITLAIDVPRAPDPVAVFDRMAVFAQQIAVALGGVMVDDNRVLLSDRSISLIRGQIAQFDQQMERQGIAAGSDVALRLFR